MSEFDEMKLRSVDGGLLLVFRELLVRRRASAVAQRLGLSPSAVSHALARLRAIYGDPLFIRRSHGLEPTRRALELAPRVHAAIEAIGRTMGADAPFDPAASDRRFRIACAEPIDSVLGPALVEVFRREAPNATFSTRWAVLEPALRAVLDGEVDVALGVFHRIAAGLLASPLFDDDYVVIARSGHPDVRGGRIDRKLYATAGHVFVGSPDAPFTHEAPVDRRTMAATYGALPGPHLIRTHAYVSHWETAMLIVAQSDVLADCPRSLAQRHAARMGLQVCEPPVRSFTMTVQAVRRAKSPDQGIDWLMGVLAAAARD